MFPLPGACFPREPAGKEMVMYCGIGTADVGQADHDRLTEMDPCGGTDRQGPCLPRLHLRDLIPGSGPDLTRRGDHQAFTAGVGA